MYAENEGVKIWYEIHGRGDPTLIMVPGFQIVHSETFKRSYVPHLSRHMRVVTLDLRGSGKSDRLEGTYDLQNCAEDVHAVVEAAGLDRFAMAGMSYGVSICLILYCSPWQGEPPDPAKRSRQNGSIRKVSPRNA